MRIILVGAVQSTERTLDKFIEHGLNVVGVFGFESQNNENVSGYVNLKSKAVSAGYQYTAFKKINDHTAEIKALKADLIFIVGLSQLVSKEIIESASQCCIGFHPTHLPSGRGRAPLAWLVLNEKTGAASFFKITEGIDDGPIVCQVPFDIIDSDDATSVYQKLLNAMDTALDSIANDIRENNLQFNPQNEANATYYARRTLEDGCINWSASARVIDRLVKSATHPHPGAFSYSADNKLTIWKSEVSSRKDIQGVVGRVIETEDKKISVQTGDGILDILEYETSDRSVLRVGSTLGYSKDIEIYNLKNEIKKLALEIKKLKGNA